MGLSHRAGSVNAEKNYSSKKKHIGIINLVCKMVNWISLGHMPVGYLFYDLQRAELLVYFFSLMCDSKCMCPLLILITSTTYITVYVHRVIDYLLDI